MTNVVRSTLTVETQQEKKEPKFIFELNYTEAAKLHEIMNCIDDSDVASFTLWNRLGVLLADARDLYNIKEESYQVLNFEGTEVGGMTIKRRV